MTLTIHLADELEQQLEQEASRFGLSTEQYSAQVLARHLEEVRNSIGSVTPEKYGRTAGLHTGAMRMSADFNAPLPDEFWSGGE